MYLGLLLTAVSGMEYIDRRKQQIQRAIQQERDQQDWNEVHEQLLAVQKKSLAVSDPDDTGEKEVDAVAVKVSDSQSIEIHGTGGTTESMNTPEKPGDSMLEFHHREIKNLLKKGLFGNPSAKNAILAWEYMQSEMTDAKRQAYALRYAKTFIKVTENLPASYLDKDSSGFQSGVLNHGPEHDELLLLLRDKATWADPGLTKLVLSMVFQAFDKPGGFTGNTPMPESRIATADELLALNTIEPQLLLDNIKSGVYDESNDLLFAAAQKVWSAIGEQKLIADPADAKVLALITAICSPQNQVKETLNDLLAIKYAENQGNGAIRPVLEEMHVTIHGYQPPESKGPYKEYSLGKLIAGSLRTLRQSKERKGVKLAYFGMKNTASVKGFSLDALQESTGGTLAGVQFGREGETNTALLDFDADFKNGIANVDAITLPFQAINYLSDSFTFKADTGYFNTVHAHFEWPEETKEEELQGLGKVEIAIGDMLMNNLRVIFEDETYGISKLAMTGLKATIYQPLGKLNSLSQLQEKFIDVFYDISQFVTYALQLSVNRFSPDTGPDAKKSLSEVLARTMYEGLAFEMTFTSFDIENLLIIDNDFPAGKTVYPVDASQGFMKKIHLGQTSLSINSKSPDPEIENYKIKQKALEENRELTDAERDTIRINKEKAAELHVQREAISKKKAKLKELLLKNEEKGETGKRNDEIKKLQDDIAKASKPEFHLTFETSGLSLDNPDMMNKIIAGQASSLADNSTINTLPGEKGTSIGKTKFETDFTGDGLTNTSLFITDLVIPDMSMSAIHYISEDKLTTLYGDGTHLSDIKASFNVYFKDPVADNPDVLIDHIDIVNIKIGEASVTSLRFGKDTPGKEVQDPHTLQNLVVPAGERIVINDLFMQGWKIAWDDQNKMSNSMMNEKSMRDAGITSSKIEAGNLLVPKGTQFTQEDMAKDGSTIIASTLDNVSFKTIKFAAARNPDSKAMDKIDYTYSYDDAEGVIRLKQTGIDKKGKPTDLGGDLNVGGTKLSNGLYYKESEEADVISFSLNKINLENFHYISDKFNLHANKPTVFNEVGLNTLVTYTLDKDNKRTGVKSVMLKGFTIENIRSEDLDIYSFTKKNDWTKVVVPGLKESGLNKISVSGLGYDFEEKKALYSSSTDIKVGLNDTLPALFVPKLQTIFGNKFAADYSTLKVGTIHLHQGGDSNMAALDVEGIELADMVMTKLNVTAGNATITSSGRPAHLKGIRAKISVEFDPGFTSKTKTIVIKSLDADWLEVYGLKMTKPGKAPDGKEIIIDTKPEQKSTIKDISLQNFKIVSDESGKSRIDYNDATGTTGLVNIPTLGISIAETLSSSAGLTAESMMFTGKEGGAFKLDITKPKVGLNDSQFFVVDDDVKQTGDLKHNSDFTGKEIFTSDSISLEMDAAGNPTYKFVNPTLKEFRIFYQNNTYDINAKVIGTMAAKEKKVDFGNGEVDAWVISSDAPIEFTDLNVTLGQSPQPQTKEGTTELPFLNTASGTITVDLGPTIQGTPIPILNGGVSTDDLGSSMGHLLEDAITTELIWQQNALDFFNWMDMWAAQSTQPWHNPLFEGLNDDEPDSITFFGNWVETQLNNVQFIQMNNGGVGITVGHLMEAPDAMQIANGTFNNAGGVQTLQVSQLLEYQLNKMPDIPVVSPHLPANWNPANMTMEQLFLTLKTDPFFQDFTHPYVAALAGTNPPNGDRVGAAIASWVKMHATNWITDNLSYSVDMDDIDLGQIEGVDVTDKSQSVSANVTGTKDHAEVGLITIPGFSYLKKRDNGKYMKVNTTGITLDKTILDIQKTQKDVTNKRIIASGVIISIEK